MIGRYEFDGDLQFWFEPDCNLFKPMHVQKQKIPTKIKTDDRFEQILYVCPCKCCTARRMFDLEKNTEIDSFSKIDFKRTCASRKRKPPSKLMGIFKDARFLRRHLCNVFDRSCNLHVCSEFYEFACPFDSCELRFCNPIKNFAISEIVSHIFSNHLTNIVLVNNVGEPQPKIAQNDENFDFYFKTFGCRPLQGLVPNAWASKYDIYNNVACAVRNIQNTLYFSCLVCRKVFHLESFYRNHKCCAEGECDEFDLQSLEKLLSISFCQSKIA